MNDSNNHVDAFDDNIWRDLIDYSNLLDDVVAPPLDPYWNPQLPPQNVGAAFDVSLSATTQINECSRKSVGTAFDASLSGVTSQMNDCRPRKSVGAAFDVSLIGATSQMNECPRKRGPSDTSSRVGTKACRERLRREKLNDRFTELFAALEPGRPVKTDKSAILGDAIRVLNQLKAESLEYKEMNEKLLEEIKTLKADKNELREEKLVLKADKERIEQQLKTTITAPPAGYVPPHPPMYQAGANKMAMFPGYGYVPMWQYLPQSTHDTSQDHKLRPPAA